MAKKYKCNENFFNTIDSDIKAYLLGFLAADGNVCSKTNRISLLLSHIDVEILELYQKFICEDCKITDKNNQNIKRKPQKMFRFSSKQIKKDLSKYGIIPNKSNYEFTLNNIPKKYKKDYIRGYFDGDGCFYYKYINGRNKICVNFTNSNKKILESIKEELELNNIKFKIEIKVSKTNKNYYVLACYNKKTFIKFGEYIYTNSYFKLNRKFKKFSYVNTVLNSEIAKGSESV